MRLAILHAPEDAALAARVRTDLGRDDALLAPLGSRLSFGEQTVLLALWTDRAAGLEPWLSQRADEGAALVVWSIEGAPVTLRADVAVLGPRATPAAVAPALRIASIEAARRAEEAEAPRRRTGLAAAALGFVTVSAIAVAAVAAVMLESDAPPSLHAARPAVAPKITPSPDLRPLSLP